MKKIILAVSVAFLIAGCAGNQSKSLNDSYAYDKSKSYGMNILRAGQVKTLYAFKDTEIDSDLYKQIMRANSAEYQVVQDVTVNVGMNAIAMQAVAGTIDTGLLASNINFGSLIGKSVLMSALSPKHPMSRWHGVVWVPQSKAKNEKEAKQVIQDTIYSASLAAIPGGTKPLTYNNNGNKRLYAKHPACVNTELSSGKNCTSEIGSDKYPYENIADDIDFELVKKPSFISGDSEYAWVGYYNGPFFQFQFFCKDYMVSKAAAESCSSYNTELMGNFSKNLPEWMYYYVTDHKTKLGTVYQGTTGKEFPLLIPKS